MHIHISKLPKSPKQVSPITKHIIIEFALKNGAECIYIFANSQNYQNRLVRLPNRHHS